MSRKTAFQFLRFSATGAIGFGVDASILYLLVASAADPYLSRILSFAAAVTITWIINRSWTFRSTENTTNNNRYLRYLLVQLTAVSVNYAFYAAVLSLIPATPANAVFALAVGSIFGLAVNFAGARAFVFKT
ncbi:MAG: GtrA family protein [Pseudomonadota bacterium]